MRQEQESRVWIVTGGLGAIVLGVLLIPLRGHTSASNLAFVFLAFAIVVAELGGRTAAIVTAVVSALSLNFFLTEPYLTLSIQKPEDIVAFLALAVCGLIAAAFGRRRERLSDLAERASGELEILDRLVARLRTGASLDDVLGDLQTTFGLEGIALRDEADRVVAAAPPGRPTRAVPRALLAPDSLLPADQSLLRFGARGLRLPENGGRLRIRSDSGSVSLDLWGGDAQGFGVSEARALTVAASILGLELARRQAR